MVTRSLPSGAFFSATSQSNQFVEFAINLTELTGLVPGCPPEGFSTLNFRSRQSPSLTSALKDYVEPITFNPGSNCSPVEIATEAVAEVLLGDAAGDTATVTGEPTATPSGTVTFTVFGPFPNDPAPEPDCAGEPVFTSDPVGLAEVEPGTATATTMFEPTEVGTYFWVASYSGDASYDPAATVCGDVGETTVVTAEPGIDTEATQAVLLGGTAADTATFAVPEGAPTPTGLVTFTVFGPFATPHDPVPADCEGTPVFTSEDVELDGGAATSEEFEPTQVGTYLWVASYAGDANYRPVTTACGEAGETTVVTAALAITTDAIPDVVLGGTATDTAMLAVPEGAPAPTGTVTFTVFGRFASDPAPVPDCSGDPVFTAADVPVVDGAATSEEFTPLQVGTYFWVAEYSGDANYQPAVTACGAAGETTVVTAEPTLTTSATTPVALGDEASDTATADGPDGGPAPTGTVTFTVFGPDDADCSGDPVFVSDPVDLVEVDAAAATADATATFLPPQVGTYLWVAEYSGDAHYGAAVTACGDADETTVVNQAAPTIVTGAVPTEPVALGDMVGDIAVVDGPDGVPVPTGTVTFTVFGPFLAPHVPDPEADCAGALVFESEPVELISRVLRTATATARAEFTPTAAGTYLWVAEYSGDDNFLAVSTACGDENEISVVLPGTPEIVTSATPELELGGAATDTATVTGVPGAQSPTGTVTFTVFGPNDPDCSGDPVFTSEVDLVDSDPATATAVATASFTPTAAGAYLWVAGYSGDANYAPATGVCGDVDETTVVTAPPVPPPPSPEPPPPSPEPPVTPAPPAQLPPTGSNAALTLLAAMGLALLGSGLVLCRVRTRWPR